MKSPAALARRHSVTSSQCKKDQQVYWEYKITVTKHVGQPCFPCGICLLLTQRKIQSHNSKGLGAGLALQPPFWNEGKITKALQVFCRFFPLLLHPYKMQQLCLSRQEFCKNSSPKGICCLREPVPQKMPAQQAGTGCWWLKGRVPRPVLMSLQFLTQNLDPSDKLGRLDIYWNIWMKHLF